MTQAPCLSIVGPFSSLWSDPLNKEVSGSYLPGFLFVLPWPAWRQSLCLGFPDSDADGSCFVYYNPLAHPPESRCCLCCGPTEAISDEMISFLCTFAVLRVMEQDQVQGCNQSISYSSDAAFTENSLNSQKPVTRSSHRLQRHHSFVVCMWIWHPPLQVLIN